MNVLGLHPHLGFHTGASNRPGTGRSGRRRRAVGATARGHEVWFKGPGSSTTARPGSQCLGLAETGASTGRPASYSNSLLLPERHSLGIADLIGHT
jgi:hypothetical protein